MSHWEVAPETMSGEGLRFVAAEVVIGLLLSEDLSEAAALVLGDDYDSPALRMLAGLTVAEPDEARALFDRALVEFDVPIPTKGEAVMRLARRTAERIIDGTATPYEGAKQIWELSLRLQEEHLSELDSFVYAASEWEDRPEDRRVFEDGIVAAARELVNTKPGLRERI